MDTPQSDFWYVHSFFILLCIRACVFIISRPSVLFCRWNARGSRNGKRREEGRKILRRGELRGIGRRSFIWGNRTRPGRRTTKLEEIPGYTRFFPYNWMHSRSHYIRALEREVSTHSNLYTRMRNIYEFLRLLRNQPRYLQNVRTQ